MNSQERLKERLPSAILESIAASSVMTLATLYFLEHPDQVGIWFPIISSSFLILSTLFDYKTTLLLLNAGGRELNTTLPEHPHSSELMSKKRLFIECYLLSLGTAFPPLGIGIATARTGVVISNLLSLRKQHVYNSIHNIPPQGKGMEN